MISRGGGGGGDITLVHYFALCRGESFVQCEVSLYQLSGQSSPAHQIKWNLHVSIRIAIHSWWIISVVLTGPYQFPTLQQTPVCGLAGAVAWSLHNSPAKVTIIYRRSGARKPHAVNCGYLRTKWSGGGGGWGARWSGQGQSILVLIIHQVPGAVQVQVPA